ncbi:MAG TPA: PKD domain-containing protein [Candidatus Paceibacterota bacterium]
MKKIITQIKFTKDRPMYLSWGLLLLIGLLVPAPALADHCDISKISIIAGPWENTDNSISLAVQTQDSAGNSCHTTSTVRLAFSASATGGVFKNQSGTAVPQAWISTNQSNRNFYYESGTLENDSITLEAGYGTADDWTVSWTVTENVADLLDTTNEDEDEDNEDGGNENGESDNNDASSHASPTPLSTKKVGTKFEVDAGRDRLAVAGGLVKFVAEMSGDNSSRVNYYWSFGDGTSERGKEVSHVYKYPGFYNVVLNARGRESEAVARTEVEVIKANLRLEIAPDKSQVMVVNEATDEVNIGNFVLDYGGQNTFIFSEDTILNPGAMVVVDEVMSGINVINKVTLKTIAQNNVVEANVGDVSEILGTSEKIVLLQELQQEVVRLQNLLQTRQQVPLIVEDSVTNSTVSSSLVSTTSTETIADVKIEPKTIVLDKPTGLWDKILVLPDRGFNFLSNIF